jgi:hypothetical protein
MPPLADSEYCWVHDPRKAKARATARRLGGVRRRREKAAGHPIEVDLTSVGGVTQLLEVAARDLLACDNGVKRSRALAYIAVVALRTIEIAELEDRLEALEQRLEVGDAWHPRESRANPTAGSETGFEDQ